MTNAPTYSHARDDLVPALARLLHHAFAGPLDGCEKWVREEVALENIRCVREGSSSPGACLSRVPMGHYFAGRSVPTLGVAGVAVAPEARGRGLARFMMEQLLREAHADGFALSSLYPSTRALYRQVGYEVAGHRYLIKIPATAIDIRDKEPRVRPLNDRDEPAIHETYQSFASGASGLLDRGPYVWRRIRSLRGAAYTGFGIDDASGGLSGYLFLNQSRDVPSGKHDVLLSDIAFTDARAARRLLSFLADFATTASTVQFAGGPDHPLLFLLNSQQHSVTAAEAWMLRIVDVGAALAQRGYPRHVAASVQFNLRDPIIKANDGVWTLEIDAGRPTVRKENAVRPEIRLSVNALAPLYTGFLSARQLARMGWLEADEPALLAADSIFAGPTPSLADFF